MMRRLLPIFALGLLAACSRIIPEAGPQPGLPVAPASALQLGAVSLPAIGLGTINPDDASAALSAFRTSCRVATSREDLSGLTNPSDWSVPCDAAAAWSDARAPEFFASQFTPVRVGEGTAFATGYFEPEILGNRTRRSATDVPIYGVPNDLERCWRDGTPESEREGEGRAPLSRRLPDGSCVPHFTRAEIEAGALDGSAPVLGYASDPIEFFFLQIQGSGRVRTPDGEIIRIGYDGQNGHGYTGIGGVMRTRGLLGDGPGQYAGSMQGIMQYLRENPGDGADLMRLNESWVFFRELTGEGPIGSIGVPVRRESSVAVDPKFVPYGAPVLLDLDRTVANGLWVAQDTGGAIRGPNRFDTFWGAGDQAREIAGGMSGRGQAVILLPNAAAARLQR
ncbi:murein transglycosylase A [Aurantiacibacter marinus]|uniref:peptidoglycan lytic exotransglycosylase n=2 Tax=Aurantiacibacter marinus TaxID=874156 RepID=A0A0H0XS28_9SPHN|nr:MltA domain-containing protein [Aurantiacibacter marinus]KLI65159.1 MltA [Aurantiacibacter marinus]